MRVADFPVFEDEHAYWSKTDEYQELPMYKKHSSLQWAFLEMRIISAKTWIQWKLSRLEMPLSPRQQKQELWPKMKEKKANKKKSCPYKVSTLKLMKSIMKVLRS